MPATVTHLTVSNPEPRRTVRDQETLPGYLSRIGQQAAPASAKVTTRALAHYASELATLTRGGAVSAIYAAGWADCEAAMAAQPHLRLADVSAASADAIREAAG